MPIVSVSGTSLKYYLLAFDKNGQERSDDPDGLMSQAILNTLSEEKITDVFWVSHGWLGDVPAAKRQYDDWVGAMAANGEDIANMHKLRPGFKPLIIGLHWPSKPFGDESLEASFAVGSTAGSSTETLIENYTAEVSDTQATREALQDIIAAENTLRAAYQRLLREAVGAEASEHSADWDASEPLLGLPTQVSGSTTGGSDVNFGDTAFGINDISMSGIQDALLGIPRKASYWKMKNLARHIGQTSGFDLLTKMQNIADEAVRFHLIGHSFGTIVVSASLRGPEKTSSLVRPISSLSLIQGAVSLWSYCAKIPERDNLQGYFYPLISAGKVNGPIITTTSQHDTAVKNMYPLASKAGLIVGNDIDFDVSFGGSTFPAVGGMGTYGLQGPGLRPNDGLMKPVEGVYDFEPGSIYNLISDKYIYNGEKDAHSAIAKPEVAHAVWSAAFGR